MIMACGDDVLLLCALFKFFCQSPICFPIPLVSFLSLKTELFPSFLCILSLLFSSSTPLRVSDGIYNIHRSVTSVPSLGVCIDVSSLKRCHASLIVSGSAEDVRLQTKLVALYSMFGRFKDGILVFDRIENPDLLSWKVLIRGYLRSRCFYGIFPAYVGMRRSSRGHDNAVFSIVLKACVELRSLNEGKQIHGDIAKVGGTDEVVFSGLLNLYAECGDLDNARATFVEMPERSVVSWTSLIVGYVRHGLLRDGLGVFNEMQEESVMPNQFTLVTVLSLCCQLNFLQQGKWVHSYLIKTGFDSYPFAATGLIDLYAKCGSISDAAFIFEHLSDADVVSWTAMIVGYTQRELVIEALTLFSGMRRAGVVPNPVTMASIISASAQQANTKEGQSFHALVVLLGLERNSEVSNSLVDMYAKCNMVKDASCVFERIATKNLISWNAMINGFSQNGLGLETLECFNQMRLHSKFSPDAVTFVGVLSACSSLGDLNTGSVFHGSAIKLGFLSNVYVGTSLLNLYSKCGNPDMARKIFDAIPEKNLTTWSAMVSGYGMHGHAKDSLLLFEDMLAQGIEPNDAIYTSILSACSHAGMVNEGFRHFDNMTRFQNVLPNMKHYACMVDMLGRAGRVTEALDFIRRMPEKPDAHIWGTLLHACKMHSTVELGEQAANELFNLHSDTGYHVLMSNMYAEAGMWEEAATIRDSMKEMGMKKSPGSSII